MAFSCRYGLTFYWAESSSAEAQVSQIVLGLGTASQRGEQRNAQDAAASEFARSGGNAVRVIGTLRVQPAVAS